MNETVLMPAHMAVHDGVAFILEIPHRGLLINPKTKNAMDNPSNMDIKYFICLFSLKRIRMLETSIPLMTLAWFEALTTIFNLK